MARTIVSDWSPGHAETSESGTVRIDDGEYPYIFHPEDGTYQFEVDGDAYRFRRWTWGEKNRVIDAATVMEPENDRLRLDIARFNELLLATTLMEASALTTITPVALRALDPVLGDALLSIAFWVNELSAQKKKL